MPIVIADLCSPPPPPPEPKELRMPGGVTIAIPFPPSDGIPSLSELMQNAMAVLQPALTPLSPIFGIIDTILAIKECIEAVPDSLGLPPDPTAIIECITNLLEKIDFLLQLLPPLSIPPMIADILDAIICLLEGILQILNDLLTQVEKIAAAEALIDDVPDLAFAVECATDTLNAKMASINASLEPVNKIFDLLNTFTGLAGLPALGPPGAAGTEIAPAVEILETTVTILKQVRAAIPF